LERIASNCLWFCSISSGILIPPLGTSSAELGQAENGKWLEKGAIKDAATGVTGSARAENGWPNYCT